MFFIFYDETVNPCFESKNAAYFKETMRKMDKITGRNNPTKPFLKASIDSSTRSDGENKMKSKTRLTYS